jgi:hypothetical protein
MATTTLVGGLEVQIRCTGSLLSAISGAIPAGGFQFGERVVVAREPGQADPSMSITYTPTLQPATAPADGDPTT